MKFGIFYDLVINDRKTQTSRIPAEKWLEWYDKEEYYIRGKEIRVDPPNPTLPSNHFIRLTERPFKTKLATVATLPEHYVREGCSSSDEFKVAWLKLYGTFDPDLDVVVLRFIRVR